MTDYERIKREFDLSQIAKNTKAIEELRPPVFDGRNLVRNGDFADYKDDEWMTFNRVDHTVTITMTEFDQTAFRSLYLTDTAPLLGQWVTLSVEARVVEDITYGTVRPYLGFELGFSRNAQTGGKSQYLTPFKSTSLKKAGEWQRISKSVFVTEHDIASYYFQMIARDFIGKVQFRHLQVELGEQASEWALAPEDTTFEAMLGRIYPIGALYLSLRSETPESRFGGNWVKRDDLMGGVNVWQRIS